MGRMWGQWAVVTAASPGHSSWRERVGPRPTSFLPLQLLIRRAQQHRSWDGSGVVQLYSTGHWLTCTNLALCLEMEGW